MKYACRAYRAYEIGRTSHEVRGLKFKYLNYKDWDFVSHLTRGAWIEIFGDKNEFIRSMSHLTRGAWIEI